MPKAKMVRGRNGKGRKSHEMGEDEMAKNKMGEDKVARGLNDKRAIWEEDQVINGRNDKGPNASGRNSKGQNGRGRSGHNLILMF